MAINDITGDTIASKHLSGDAKRRFDESFDRIFGKPSDGQCKKCGGLMVKGKAIEQTHGGTEDFPGGGVVTMSPSGPGKLINCLKCEACGWSIRNNPQECGAYNAGGNAPERSEGRVDHNVSHGG